MTGWTDEARAASLAVREAEAKNHNANGKAPGQESHHAALQAAQLHVTETKTTRTQLDGAITKVTLSDGRAFKIYRDAETQSWNLTPDHIDSKGFSSGLRSIGGAGADFLGHSKQEAINKVPEIAGRPYVVVNKYKK